MLVELCERLAPLFGVGHDGVQGTACSVDKECQQQQKKSQGLTYKKTNASHQTGCEKIKRPTQLPGGDKIIEQEGTVVPTHTHFLGDQPIWQTAILKVQTRLGAGTARALDGERVNHARCQVKAAIIAQG